MLNFAGGEAQGYLKHHSQAVKRLFSAGTLLAGASAPTRFAVGAGLGRDAGDAVFQGHGGDAIASKLCSHSVKPTTGAKPGTVGAKLARERPVQVAHKHRISHRCSAQRVLSLS